jgi:hypothetical protein
MTEDDNTRKISTRRIRKNPLPAVIRNTLSCSLFTAHCSLFVHCSLIPFCVILDPFKAHLGNLLGDETHEEDQDGVDEQNRGHIGEAMIKDEGVEIIDQAGHKKKDTDGKKDFERRKKGGDSEHNQEEA